MVALLRSGVGPSKQAAAPPCWALARTCPALALLCQPRPCLRLSLLGRQTPPQGTPQEADKSGTARWAHGASLLPRPHVHSLVCDTLLWEHVWVTVCSGTGWGEACQSPLHRLREQAQGAGDPGPQTARPGCQPLWALQGHMPPPKQVSSQDRTHQGSKGKVSWSFCSWWEARAGRGEGGGTQRERETDTEQDWHGGRQSGGGPPADTSQGRQTDRAERQAEAGEEGSECWGRREGACPGPQVALV